jgi:hypothetical protein
MTRSRVFTKPQNMLARKMSRLIAVFLSAPFLMIANASADTVIYQSISNLQEAPNLSSSWDFCSPCGSVYTTMKVFSSFSIGTSSTVNQIQFDVSADNGSLVANGVTVSIYNSSSGTVGSQVFSQTFSAAQFNTLVQSQYTVSGITAIVDLITVSPTAFALSAGSYWIAFYNSSSLLEDVYSGGSYMQVQNGTTYNSGPDTLGFSLSDVAPAVPEPSTWAMMLLGFAGVGFMAYRRKAKPASMAA